MAVGRSLSCPVDSHSHLIHHQLPPVTATVHDLMAAADPRRASAPGAAAGVPLIDDYAAQQPYPCCTTPQHSVTDSVCYARAAYQRTVGELRALVPRQCVRWRVCVRVVRVRMVLATISYRAVFVTEPCVLRTFGGVDFSLVFICAQSVSECLWD
eukprot:COSAG02_NODE_12209_length_1580_cov_1.773126_1_plen_154_part_10